MFNTLTDIISIFTHASHFPGFSKTICFKWSQFHKRSNFFYQPGRLRFSFSVNKFVNGRTLRFTILCQCTHLHIFFVDINLKHIRKYRHNKKSFHTLIIYSISYCDNKIMKKCQKMEKNN